MRMERERQLLREENSMLKWNAKYSEGQRVRFWTGLREGEGRTGTAWTQAVMLGADSSGKGGHTAVVYIRDDQGRNVGCVSLTHVEPIEARATAG